MLEIDNICLYHPWQQIMRYMFVSPLTTDIVACKDQKENLQIFAKEIYNQ